VDAPEPTGRKDSAQEASADRQEPALPAGRRLSRTQQFAVLFVVALLLAGLLAGQAVWHAIGPQAAHEATPAQSEADTVFRPTPQQWAGFRIQPAEDKPFRPAQDTDGKIAIDDDRVTPVFSPYSGRVVKLFASAGDTVRQGDPLCAVEATEFVQAQNDLIAAVATLRTARAQAALAETNEKRQHNLYLSQGAALKDWQQAQVDLASAQGNLSSAQIAVSAVRNRLRILGRSDAEITAIETAPDLMRLDPVAVVPAPIGGTVIQRQVGLGQTIVSAAAGATTSLFQIGDLSKVWLVANVREEDAPLIHRGDSVEVHVLAFPDRVFTARVTHVAPTIDANTHRLSVRAELDNPDGALKPEMFASFRIITGPATTSLAIPIGALVYEGSDVHVWVANPADKTIASRDIRLGAVRDGMAQVLDGLKPGDQVVTAGSLFIDRAVTGD
jgi:cobalt-zinc-cadmium efflux system membrane fusion protein